MAEIEQTDTPQLEVHSVDTGAVNEGSVVEDVIFGGEQGSVSEAFDQVEEAISQPESIEQQPAEEPSVQPQAENEEVRYQYWQSQADKLKNERDQIQAQFNNLAVQQTPQQEQPAQEVEPEFPSPPEKPERPYNFSMDEAMADPNSDSAKFTRSEQAWRDEMDDYKNMQFEYQMAMLQDEREQTQQQRQADVQRQQAEQQQAQEVTNIRSQVMDQFKVDQNTANDFVRVMSDPSSISLDNLWKLYASDKGLSSPETPANSPSGEFQQVKRAQQVPASMGVLPSQNRQNTGSIEETIMDSMIGDYNKQNPFN
jgi:hypothetical protein